LLEDAKDEDMKDQKEEEKELLWSYEPIDELIPQELFFI